MDCLQLHASVQDAATTNSGVWVTFLAIVGIYLAVGVTTILVLRGMARRWRDAGGGEESDVPYGPSAPPTAAHDEVLVG